MRLRFLLTALVVTVAAHAAAAQPAGGVGFLDLKFKKALAKATKEDKFVFVDCYTEWCGPCKYMANTVFTQPEAGDYFNPTFVCIKIDMEKGEGVELGRRYGVEAYPTFLVLDSKGELVHKVIGASQTVGEFIAVMDKGLDPDNSTYMLGKRYAAGDRDREMLAKYTAALIGQRDVKKAAEVAKALIASTPEQERFGEPLWFIYNDPGLSAYGSDIFDFVLSNRERFEQAVGAQAVGTKIYNEMAGALSMIFVGGNRNATMKDVDALAGYMAANDLPNMDMLVLYVELAKGRLTHDAAQVLAALTEVAHRWSDQQASKLYFGPASVVREYGTDEQRAELIALSGSLLDKTTDNRLQLALTEFIKYISK